MEHATTEEVEPRAGTDDAEMRPLGGPLGTEDMAINHYTLAPGEAFSGGLHAHLDQEEVFYVIEGTATFEYASGATEETETVEIEAGEGIRFAPGEYQRGRNEGDEPIVALALGAPIPSTEVRVPTACRECGESDALAFTMGEDGAHLECPECGEGFAL